MAGPPELLQTQLTQRRSGKQVEMLHARQRTTMVDLVGPLHRKVPTMRPTPVTLLLDQFRVLDAHLPAVRNGDPVAIHDARVATRRIRELVPLCPAELGLAEELGRVAKELGRALGRVRDCDVQLDLLSGLQTKVPHAGGVLAVLQHEARVQKERRLRQLVKRLPDDLSREARVLVKRQTFLAWREYLWAAPWRRTLAAQLAARRESAVASIGHAGGIYFPNRLHQVRIDIKKLRYAAEISACTGLLGHADASLRRLRKVQGLLGEIHDRQLVYERLDEAAKHEQDANRHSSMLGALVHSDIEERHHRFVSRIDDLITACNALVIPGTGRTVLRALPAATVAAAIALAVQARRT